MASHSANPPPIDSARVRLACAAVDARPEAKWPVARLAAAGGASVPQIQRAFRAVLGISPRDYVLARRRRQFLDGLRRGRRVTDALYEAGYGSPSRVYGGEIRLPGMTPATYGRGGRGADIEWTTTTSSLGTILVAATARGVCFVEVGGDRDLLVAGLRREFPEAVIRPGASARLRPLATAARAAAEAGDVPADLPVDIRGTAFQWRVWRALTRIPRGETRTYSEIARAIGDAPAVRAVARACATNPIALLVPCHRVIGKDGALRGYRWGTEVKRQLLDREKSNK